MASSNNVNLNLIRNQYKEVELLMADPKNVEVVRAKLNQINCNFDSLMCATVNVLDGDSMPGSVTHKIDVIDGNTKFVDRVESWVNNVVPGDVADLYVLVPENVNRKFVAPDGEMGPSERFARKPRDDSVPASYCAESVCGGSKVSRSSGSSRSSRIRDCKAKVVLARLALKQDAERRQDEESRRLEEARFATREKQRQLELAEAELKASEMQSVSDISEVLSLPASPPPSRSCLIKVDQNKELKGDTNHISSSREPLENFEKIFENFSCRNEAEKLQRSERDPVKGQLKPRFNLDPRAQPYLPQSHPVAVAQSKGAPTVFDRSEGNERFLPKPSIEHFNGDPLDFWAFVNRYDVHIAARIGSDDLRLAYLLQHCSRDVYEKIKHHASSPDKRLAYEAVWRDLFERYGQPHIITSCCERRLADLPKISQFDTNGLERLAVLMKRCLTSLERVSGDATMNSVGFISSIANKLPIETRKSWVSKALEIQRQEYRIANFAEFAEFVNLESERANSAFYKSIFTTENINYRGKAKVFNTSESNSATFGSRKAGFNKNNRKVHECVCCNGPHKLVACDEFCGKSPQDRRDFARSKRLCYRCLNLGHMIKDCRSDRTCAKRLCQSTSHHTLLHFETEREQDARTDNVVSACANETKALKSFLDIVPVRVCHDGNEVVTYALLDPGSSSSFCEQKLVDALNMRGHGTECKMAVETLTTEKPQNLKSVSYSFIVKSLDGVNEFNLKNVTAIDQIPVTSKNRNVCGNLNKYEHLRGVSLPRINNATVTLLIGNDHFMSHFPLETRMSPNPAGPHGVKFPLGWVLKGADLEASLQSDRSSVCSFLLNRAGAPNCLDNLENLLVTEEGQIFNPASGLDIADVSNLMSWLQTNEEIREFGLKYSAEDVIAYDLMRKNVRYDSGHYELPLLWKNAAVTLPESKAMAYNRLQGVKQKLLRDEELRKKYCEQMNKVLEKGYAERVPDNQCQTSNRVWYIPHHPVVNPNKPDKLRIVYDCAAKSHGVSLNEKLMKGPDLVNRLIGVLLRFRKEQIAIVADIESMFYQVRCSSTDQDALRFLWWPDGDLTAKPVPHRMKVHLFGAKSSPSCASFALLETAKQFGKYYSKSVVDVVKKSFYVDDCLTSVSNESAGVKVISDLSHLLSRGGFRLTKWISSSETIMRNVSPDERAKVANELEIGGKCSERVLGMKWNIVNDAFEFDINLPEKPPTRRGLLSITNAVFDPLGLVSPVILESRLMFRKQCQLKLGWDEDLRLADATRWMKWKNSLVSLKGFSLPRCHKPKDQFTDVQLHVFADASNSARGAVCYLRHVDSHEKVHCSLVMAKSLLANSEKQTIPRLELEAALDAVKLAKIVRTELELQECEVIYWTDSAIVLQSLHAASKNFPVFARNRLAQIQSNTCIYDWRHVPSRLNPADLASRGCTADVLIKCDKWFKGPEFLNKPHTEWPHEFVVKQNDDDCYRVFDRSNTQVSLFVKTPAQVTCATDSFINYFSSFYRLKLAAAHFLRYKSFLLGRAKGIASCKDFSKNVSTEELQQAELELVKYVQQSCFPEWFGIASGNYSSLKSNVLYSLNPMLVDSVLRVGGRLANANLPYEAKHPAILPSQHHLTQLIISNCHAKEVGHLGTNATLNQVMKRFWVVNPRATVNKVLRQCLQCKRRTAKPNNQIMADLPPARLHMYESPFSHTGVDYFGPYLIKQRRSEVKRYGCIFTCMTTRAVHLEVAPDLTSSSFINALRRFVARRGPVVHLYSDNGSNFIGAEKELRKSVSLWNNRQIIQELRQRNIQWTFNPAGASHMGGCWERMIRTVKQILVHVLPRKNLDDDTLHTSFLEIEAIINSRPLTDVSPSADDLLPLTPNHLLRLEPSIGFPPTISAETDAYEKQRYKVVQYVADEFWKRWVEEYPRTLLTRQKWNERRKNIKVNDIVLVVDYMLPRGQWPMARVVRLYPDKLGVVRVADVKTASGVLKRPVSKLCVFVSENDSD